MLHLCKSLTLCVFVYLMCILAQNTVAKSFQIREQREVDSSNPNGSWKEHLKLLRSEMKDCVKLTSQSSWTCFKQKSLHIIGNLTSAPVIPIGNGLRLVRIENNHMNNTRFEGIFRGNSSSNAYERLDLQHLTWFDHLTVMFEKILTTHMLQINLRELTDAYLQMVDKQGKLSDVLEDIYFICGLLLLWSELHTPLNQSDPIGTARHRRHRNNMIITMMFGVTALGAILIPMGFQMLSIVSGKALLLAKMALLLASINGLKRIANSGVHYGLYQVPGEHYGGYYDRGSDLHHPRLALATPLEEFGIQM